MTLLRVVAIFAAVQMLLAGQSKRPWTEGVPVQLTSSNIEIRTVTSRPHQDFDPFTHNLGPIFFDDCVAYVNRGKIAAVHIQFIFVAVDDAGQIKRQPLPLDVTGKAEPNVLSGDENCRYHVYPNRDRGLWLVAWPNVVDFADGTHWQAPPIEQMTPYIFDSLPRASSSS